MGGAGLAEDVGGMEGGDADLGEIAGEQLSALFGDLEALADEVVRAGRADAEDDLGRDEL